MLKKMIPTIISIYLKVLDILFPNKATEKAFDIFCTPRKGKASDKHQNFFDTSIQEKHQIEDLQIATYQWQGSKETIVLLHGWESNSFRWKNLIENLKEYKYNIIAIDAPAQGNSSGKFLNVPLYTECAKHIIEIYKPSILIGHSLGAMSAIYYQYTNQNPNIDKIVALGPPSELSLFMKGFQNTLSLSNHFMDKLGTYIYDTFNVHPKDFSVAKFACHLKNEGLLILEKFDQLAPFKYSKPIADNWEKCTLAVVENIGHSLQDKNIDTKILEFLNQN